MPAREGATYNPATQEATGGTKADHKHHVSVRQPTDRALLVCIYEQNRQICQVRADWWCQSLEGNTMVSNDHEAIIGANIFKDILAGVRDIVGGRSGAYEDALRSAREEALREMIEEAMANSR